MEDVIGADKGTGGGAPALGSERFFSTFVGKVAAELGFASSWTRYIDPRNLLIFSGDAAAQPVAMQVSLLCVDGHPSGPDANAYFRTVFTAESLKAFAQEKMYVEDVSAETLGELFALALAGCRLAGGDGSCKRLHLTFHLADEIEVELPLSEVQRDLHPDLARDFASFVEATASAKTRPAASWKSSQPSQGLFSQSSAFELVTQESSESKVYGASNRLADPAGGADDVGPGGSAASAGSVSQDSTAPAAPPGECTAAGAAGAAGAGAAAAAGAAVGQPAESGKEVGGATNASQLPSPSKPPKRRRLPQTFTSSALRVSSQPPRANKLGEG